MNDNTKIAEANVEFMAQDKSALREIMILTIGEISSRLFFLTMEIELEQREAALIEYCRTGRHPLA